MMPNDIKQLAEAIHTLAKSGNTQAAAQFGQLLTHALAQQAHLRAAHEALTEIIAVALHAPGDHQSYIYHAQAVANKIDSLPAFLPVPEPKAWLMEFQGAEHVTTSEPVANVWKNYDGASVTELFKGPLS